MTSSPTEPGASVVAPPGDGSVVPEGMPRNGTTPHADEAPTGPAPGPALDPEVAAGVVLWREGSDGRDPERAVEVLLVHRPRYDDWSFPKGKVEPGETLPECAVRETAEETGIRVRLGRPLPQVRYTLPDGRPKEVSYWTARALSSGRPRGSEVDQSGWFTLRAARKRITREGDAALLDALAATAADRRLRTVPLLVVRHATARPRQAWTHADGDRPLVAAGRRQSLALAALLQSWSPEYLLSSPWLRCTDTLAPYAAATGARVRTKGGLTEDGFEHDPRKAARHTQRLLDRQQAALLCTHRPVLPGVVSTLARAATDDARAALPTKDPFLDPAEVLVAHVTRRSGRSPVVVEVERHSPHR